MAASRDNARRFTYSKSLVPQSATTTGNGTSVDTRAAESVVFVADVGADGGTTPSFTLQMQESEDNSTWNAVAAGDVTNGGQLAAITAAAGTEAVYQRGYKGVKRYVRWAISAVSGTSPTLLLSASVVTSHLRRINES